MAKSSVKLTDNRLGTLAATARRNAARLVDRTAINIRQGAEALVPIDTGALKQSITVTDQGELTRTVTAGGGTVTYAEHVEWGTSKAPAQPFFTPAVEAERPAFEQGVKGLLDG